MTDLRWFRKVTSPVAPSARLVCFPHAGGTAGVFHGWGAHVPDDVEVLAVRYPGRQERLAEPCIDSMAPLADAISAALGDGVPTVLFGHSMGASVAHEVAMRRRVAMLVVSARVPPHLLRPRDVHLGGDDAIIADVKRLGAASADVLDDPELRELVLPAVRADYRLVGTYSPGRLPPIDVPVVGFAGEHDPGIRPSDMAEWATATTAGFDLEVFPGGHFYLLRHEADLVVSIVSRMAALRAMSA